MAISFYNMFSDLEAMGLFDIVLPFLLVFTIIFAIINRTKILGDRKGIDVVVSFVIALLAVRSEFFVELMKSFLPNVAMFMVVILMFLLMLGTFAGQNKEWTGIFWGIGAVISFIFILFALLFDYTAGYVNFPNWLRDLFYSIDDRTKSIILFLAVLVIVLWFLTRDKAQTGESLFEKLMKGPGGSGRS